VSDGSTYFPRCAAGPVFHQPRQSRMIAATCDRRHVPIFRPVSMIGGAVR
jgi:hypothetical protein